MSSLQRHRDAVLASLSLGLLALTSAWPEWIEGTTGLDPDAGSGAVEWLLVAGFTVLFVLFGVRALRALRTTDQPS